MFRSLISDYINQIEQMERDYNAADPLLAVAAVPEEKQPLPERSAEGQPVEENAVVPEQ